MKLTLATISARSRSKSEAAERLAADYLARARHYAPIDSLTFDGEAALFKSLEKESARTPTHLVLLDSRGQLLTSEELAAQIGRLRDSGTQRILFAIGPADGWSKESQGRAQLLFSLGRITLAHELARTVLAEQIYRALTILAGHPYHSGH